MGCHTWVFKKEHFFTPEEQLKVLNATKVAVVDDFPRYEEWLKTEFGMINLELGERHCREVYEHCQKDRAVLKRAFEKATDFESFKRFYGSLSVLNFDAIGIDTSELGAKCQISGDWYYTEFDFDNPFRVFGYPENQFTDIEELLKWLEAYALQYPSGIGYYDDDNKFIEGYSDELVSRINQYADKNGRDQLFFEFG